MQACTHFPAKCNPLIHNASRLIAFGKPILAHCVWNHVYWYYLSTLRPKISSSTAIYSITYTHHLNKPTAQTPKHTHTHTHSGGAGAKEETPEPQRPAPRPNATPRDAGPGTQRGAPSPGPAGKKPPKNEAEEKKKQEEMDAFERADARFARECRFLHR
jgi:hypothetical protein